MGVSSSSPPSADVDVSWHKVCVANSIPVLVAPHEVLLLFLVSREVLIASCCQCLPHPRLRATA